VPLGRMPKLVSGRMPEMNYSVVLEEGRDGGFTAWVVELPGCFARAPTREQIEIKLSAAIRDFLQWRQSHGDAVQSDDVAFEIVSSVVTVANAAEGDTSVLLVVDRAPLEPMEWRRTETWLEDSRQELLRFLQRVRNVSLDWTPEGSSRSLQQTIFHLAMVEIMYAVWTFDLHSMVGVEEFLAWTRRVASARMRELADRSDDQVTVADWAGAPKPEEWTARKAARRLLWHERLHRRSLECHFREQSGAEQARTDRD